MNYLVFGYAVLGISALATGLLVVAYSMADHYSWKDWEKKRFGKFAVVSFSLLPLGVFLMCLFMSYTGQRIFGFPASGPVYVWSLTAAYLLGTTALFLWGWGKKNSKARAQSWRRLWLGLGALSALVVFASTILYLNNRIYEDMVSEFEATQAEIYRLLPPSPPEQENAWPLYGKAFKKLRGVPLNALEGVFEAGLDPQSPEAKSLLKAAGPALALLHEAASRPSLHYRFCLGTLLDNTSVFSERPPNFLTASNLLALDSLNKAARGDLSGALARVNDMQSMACQLYSYPRQIMHSYIGLVVHARAFKVLKNIINAFPAESWQNLSLEPGCQAWKPSDTMLSIYFEKARFLSVMINNYNDYHGGDFYKPLDVVLADFKDPAELKWGKSFVARVTDLLAKGGLPERDWGKSRPFLFDEYYCVGDLNRDQFRRQMYTGLIRLGVAVRSFRAKTGAWPEKLDDLVPNYLKKIPEDPFSIAPLKLKKEKNCLVLYSLGSNKRDDQGGKNDIAIKLTDSL